MSDTVKIVGDAIDAAAIAWIRAQDRDVGMADVPPEVLARAAIESLRDVPAAVLLPLDRFMRPAAARELWGQIVDGALSRGASGIGPDGETATQGAAK